MHVFLEGERAARGRRGLTNPPEGRSRESPLLARQIGTKTGEGTFLNKSSMLTPTGAYLLSSTYYQSVQYVRTVVQL